MKEQFPEWAGEHYYSRVFIETKFHPNLLSKMFGNCFYKLMCHIQRILAFQLYTLNTFACHPTISLISTYLLKTLYLSKSAHFQKCLLL